jgi:hypothetical protein
MVFYRDTEGRIQFSERLIVPNTIVELHNKVCTVCGEHMLYTKVCFFLITV